MPAFKKIKNHTLYIDMDEAAEQIKNSRRILQANKDKLAKKKTLERIDPLVRFGGKRCKIQSVEELQAGCDRYFESRRVFVRDKYGHPVKDPVTGELVMDTLPLTVSGLGLELGIDTTALKEYKEKVRDGTLPAEYAGVLFDALQKIESYAETQSYSKDGQRGAQFVLQAAFNWNTNKEEKECKKLSVEAESIQSKSAMSKEEHGFKMQMLKAGLDSGEDRDINITITRASKN